MLKVVLFTSRNKDNTGVTSFKQRNKNFLVDDSKLDKIYADFEKFREDGVPGEISRMYISVNGRDSDKTKRSLISYMVLNPEFKLESIEKIAVSHAMKPENRAEKKWMFDFDINNRELAGAFAGNCSEIIGWSRNLVEVWDTPHGFCIVTPRGFDIRQLDDKFRGLIENGNITLMKDGMLFVKWAKK